MPIIEIDKIWCAEFFFTCVTYCYCYNHDVGLTQKYTFLCNCKCATAFMSALADSVGDFSWWVSAMGELNSQEALSSPR